MTDLDRARDLIARAARCVVLTGAGISAESGVPTFRGAGGLWKSYRAEDLATPAAFARDPRLVWEWYGWRRDIVMQCAPNAAHRTLARFALERARANAVTIVTQNVDGLHAAAASDEAGDRDATAALPVELHGSLFRVRCTACSWHSAHRETIDATSLETLPRCPRCHALARPHIVWFGEQLDEATIGRAFDDASAADICVVIGTSAVVQPAASIALATRDAGGAVIEINPDETPLTRVATVSIRAAAATTVPAIFA